MLWVVSNTMITTEVPLTGIVLFLKLGSCICRSGTFKFKFHFHRLALSLVVHTQTHQCCYSADIRGARLMQVIRFAAMHNGCC